MQKLTRTPIVVLLGHVDHGKTTLLDSIRKTDIVSREAGGITQKIGATLVTLKNGKKITFIDTPGHAAFTKMRGSGASVADIALLVIASDDGVKPQTLESLLLIQSLQTPFIVVATKIDLPSSSIELVKKQLENNGVLFEGRGGDTPIVGISSKTKVGIDDLLETIILLAEVKEVSGDVNGVILAPIIETSKGKAGPLVSVVVRNGTLKIGTEIYTSQGSVKVKRLFDYQGKQVKEIYLGEPGTILGFSDLPQVGEVISSQKILTKKDSLNTHQGSPQNEEGKLSIFIKANNSGSLEAILSNLPSGVKVVHSGIGDIYESDILDAKSYSSKFILAFESKINPSTLKLAESEGVKVEIFKIIYELFQKIEEILALGKTEIVGEAKILAVFPYKGKRVAGCKITTGKIAKNDKLLVTRLDKSLGEVKVMSIRKQKETINEAKEGEECGILFEPQLDFEINDMLLSARQ